MGDLTPEQIDELKKVLDGAVWLLNKYVVWGPDEDCALARAWLDDYKAVAQGLPALVAMARRALELEDGVRALVSSITNHRSSAVEWNCAGCKLLFNTLVATLPQPKESEGR